MAEKQSYFKYWGKARKREDGGYERHLLVYHCLDVGAVGWLGYVSIQSKDRWNE
jgi:hypothetical protein